MIRLPKSVFRDMVVWYTICVSAVVATYTALLYYEIERGRRQPFDIKLDARAEQIAAKLYHDNGTPDITYFSEADLSNSWFAIFDMSWHPLLFSLNWQGVSWTNQINNSAEFAVRIKAGKKYHQALYSVFGDDMRLCIMRTQLRPLPDTFTSTAHAGGNPSVYLVCADLYEPVANFLGRQMYRMLAALIGVMAVIVASGIIVARMSVRPIKRLANAARRITPEDPCTRLPADKLPDELRLLALRLNEAFDRLDTALVAERNFTAAAAHELRSPVAGIAARLDNLRHHDKVDPELRQNIDLIYADAERLIRLSGQLLLLSRLDRAAAGEAFKASPIDLLDVANDVADALHGHAATRAIAIKVEAHGDATISGHEEWILRAVHNVVSNAVKFTAANSTVSIRLEPTADNQRIMLSVVDAGPGIPPEDRHRVFERFYRSAKTAKTEGTGLGLAIVYDVVKAHKGEFFISAGPGNSGTNVTLILPRSRAA